MLVLTTAEAVRDAEPFGVPADRLNHYVPLLDLARLFVVQPGDPPELLTQPLDAELKRLLEERLGDTGFAYIMLIEDDDSSALARACR